MNNDNLSYAVIGYVPNAVAEGLKQQQTRVAAKVELRVEPETDEVLVRIDGSSITEVRTGASQKGYTAVQLILRENDRVETVLKSEVSKGGIRRLNDPTLPNLTSRAIVSVIFSG